MGAQIALMLVLLGGCDGVFGIATFPEPKPDAASAPFSCTTLPAAFGCADFEQPMPTVFARGVPTTPAAPTGMVTGQLAMPGFDSPGAFAIDTTADTYFVVDLSESGVVTALHATLAVDLPRVDAGDIDIVKLGFDATGLASCYGFIRARPGQIYLGHHCDSVCGEFRTLIQAIPAGFTTYRLDMDLAAATVTAQVGQALETIPLNPAAMHGKPYAQVGADPIGGVGNARVVLDDIVVTTTP